MELWILALLALVGFVAGFIDAIAGGGGLLALPSLLLAGLDPVAALATNKLQGSFGTASATYAFWKQGRLRPQDHIFEIVMVFAGAALGVAAVAYAPTAFLAAAMPVLLILIAAYFLLSPKLDSGQARPRLAIKLFSFGFAPVLGFYDGIFGPGTGSFFMVALVALFGFGIVEATARTKLLNFTSNIASLLVFAMGGKVIWSVGLTMGVAQFLGAQLGANLAVRNGAAIIKPLLVLACCVMAIRLLLDPANPLRSLLNY
jgi:uncharacterized protein